MLTMYFAVNPNIVKNPFPITEITYDEMRELAYAGFSVLHEEALYPVYVRGIPVHIRNTNNPSAKGTRIVSERTHYDSLVTGIAGAKGFLTITVTKYLMNHEVGFISQLLTILAEEGVPVEHIPSGIDSVTIIARKKYFTPEKEDIVINRFRNEARAEISQGRPRPRYRNDRRSGYGEVRRYHGKSRFRPLRCRYQPQDR